jgi:hypothetical protein
MVIFKRLYATYYFFFIKKRHLHKKLGINKFLMDRNEDDRALAALATSQFFIIMLVLGTLKKTGYIIIHSPAIFIIIPIYGLLILSQYLYFIKNRERRRKVIEDYRELPNPIKFVWRAISICLFIGPIFLFPIVFSRN